MAVDSRRPRGDAVAVRLGRALREERVEAKLTQDELAAKARTPQGQISYWERGERQPSLGEIGQLETALGLPNGALLIAAGCVDERVDTAAAIAADPKLDRQHRELLLEYYKIHVQRSRRGK